VKTITVVLPVWNGAALIGMCLASLVPQLQPGDEIIIADNGSSDGTPELVERDFPQAQVLRLERNWGYGGGANRGLVRAHADAVLILNHDVTFNADCLAMLRRRLELSGPAVIGCSSHIRTVARFNMRVGLSKCLAASPIITVIGRPTTDVGIKRKSPTM
jgi:GT2 family glycosyltransferase